PLALEEVGDGVEAEGVDTQLQPEVEDLEDGFVYRLVVEVQVGLVGEEAMPVVGLRHRVPGPVGGLEVLEDDAGVCVLLRGITPDVEVAPRRSGPGPAGPLKPGVLVAGVVED